MIRLSEINGVWEKNSLLVWGLTYLATPAVLGWPRGGRPVGRYARNVHRRDENAVRTAEASLNGV